MRSCLQLLSKSPSFLVCRRRFQLGLLKGELAHFKFRATELLGWQRNRFTGRFGAAGHGRQGTRSGEALFRQMYKTTRKQSKS